MLKDYKSYTNDFITGTLRIHGDPSERGNVELRLEELDSPVLIEPGTKNLTLIKKLDKEVSHLYNSVLNK